MLVGSEHDNGTVSDESKLLLLLSSNSSSGVDRSIDRWNRLGLLSLSLARSLFRPIPKIKIANCLTVLD